VEKQHPCLEKTHKIQFSHIFVVCVHFKKKTEQAEENERCAIGGELGCCNKLHVDEQAMKMTIRKVIMMILGTMLMIVMMMVIRRVMRATIFTK